MQNIIYLFTLSLFIFLFSACKPDSHPKNPNYEIIKPKVKYTPGKKSLDKMVKELQGSPYVWAEEGPNNFDCSGFTYYLYGSMGIEIPRVAREQAKQGKKISVNELVYGDLIFFDTERSRRGRITHVGMYLGNGWFTHASTTKHEIIYSNLNTSPYYKKRLRICRRYLPQTEAITAKNRIKPWKVTKTQEVQKPQQTVRQELPTKQKRPVAQKEEGNFYVQVGSFSGKPHHTLLYNITSKGYRYRLIQFPIGKKQVSKLLIGPYTHRAEAKAVLPKIKKQIQKAAFIAEIR